MSLLRFQAEDHTYWKGEIRIASVSEILKANRAKDFYQGTTACDKGSRVHAATEAMDTLELSPLDFEDDSDMYPYLRAWEQFQAETKVRILRVEHQVYHEALAYAGTMDRLVEINGVRTVIDIKTGVKAPWHREQTAAYALAWQSMGFDAVTQGIACYLAKTGKYKIDVYSGDEFEDSKNLFAGWARRYETVTIPKEENKEEAV